MAQPGQTAAVISGYLAAMEPTPEAFLAISTTYGSSIPLPTNGHGWAEANLGPSTKARLRSTAAWEHLRRRIFPEAAMAPQAGRIAAGISGSLAATASM